MTVSLKENKLTHTNKTGSHFEQIYKLYEAPSQNLDQYSERFQIFRIFGAYRQ